MVVLAASSLARPAPADAAAQSAGNAGQEAIAFPCAAAGDARATRACVANYIKSIMSLSADRRYNLTMEAFFGLPCTGVSEAKDLLAQETLQAAQEMGFFDGAIVAMFNRGACLWDEDPPDWPRILAKFAQFRNAVAPYINPNVLDTPERISDQALVFRGIARRYVRFLENADRVSGAKTCGRLPDTCLVDAWALAQRLKSRMFHSRMLQVHVASDRSGELKGLLEQQFEVLQVREALRAGLRPAPGQSLRTAAQADSEEARISNQIEARFPDYARLYSGLAPTIEEVQASLRENEIYVSYLFTDSRRKPIAFILAKHGPAKMIQLPKEGREIKQMISEIQEGILEREPPARLSPKLNSAAAALLDPLGLPGSARLIVEADEELSGLPFILLGPQGQSSPTRSITYVPSAGVFRSLRRNGRGTGTSYVGLGRGRFEPPLEVLGAVQAELAAAALTFPPGSRTTDPEALEKTVYDHAGEMRRARVLHFATHTVYDKGRVGLLFHEGAGEDGLLTETEILTRIRTSADLVILSGCDTARLNREGDIAGEAFSALTRAFFAAGARKLLITQWAVDDRFASMMVTHFMRVYSATGDAERALADAQRAVREDPAARVKHWAGWALLSD